MKKTLLSLLTILFVNASVAQQKAPQENTIHNIKNIESIVPQSSSASSFMPAPFWSNDFSTQSDWTMVDLLNGGLQNWVITTNGPVGSYSAAMGVINSTTAANGFALFDSDALNTQYTPQEATLTYNGTIDCSAYQYININFECSHRVFRDSVFVEISTDNFATVAGRYRIQPALATNESSPNPEFVSLNISSSAGNQSNVYLRFHYEGEWDYAIMIDDVNFSETPDNELILSNPTFGGWWLGYQATGDLGCDYTLYPMKQALAMPYRIEGVVRNSGIQTQNNITLHVDVDEVSTSNITSLTSSPISLSMLQNDTVATTTNFSPTNMGQYNMSFWATSDSFPTTDTTTFSSIVTDSVYGVDYDWNSDGANASGYAFLSRPACGQVLANVYDIYSNTTLTSISFHISNQSVPFAEVTAQLYEADGQIFISESDVYTLQPSDIGQWVTLPLLIPTPLFAGTSYYAAVEGTLHPTDTVGISISGNPHASGWIQDNGCDLNSANPSGTWYSTSAKLIRMNFGYVSSVQDEDLKSGFSVYPNPSSGIVNLANENNSEYSFTVKNVVGQLIYDGTISSYSNKSINLSQFSKGIYLIEFTNKKQTYSKKVVIE